jgi:hypothetical protein
MKRKDVNNPFSGYLPAPPAYLRPAAAWAIVKRGVVLAKHPEKGRCEAWLAGFGEGAKVEPLA